MLKNTAQLLQRIDYFLILAQDSAEEQAKKLQEQRSIEEQRILEERRKLDKNRQRALNLARLKNTIEPNPIYTREQRLSGGTKRNVYDFNTISLEGLVTHITQKLLGQRKTLKDVIVRKLQKLGKDPALFKTLLNDIQDAANKQDRRALLESVRYLRQNGVEGIESELIPFLAQVRAAKFFFSFRNLVQTISKLMNEPTMPGDRDGLITKAIYDGENLIRYYKDLAIPSITEDRSTPTNWRTVVDMISLTVEKLKQATQSLNKMD